MKHSIILHVLVSSWIGTSAVIFPALPGANPLPVRLDGSSPEKAPTAVLVKANYPHDPIAFGADALAALECQTERESQDLLFLEFKMQLRPGGLTLGREVPEAFKVKDVTGQEWPLLVPIVATLIIVKKMVTKRLKELIGPERLTRSEIRRDIRSQVLL